MNSKQIIRYKYEWFNPIYFHVKKYLEDNSIRRILAYGGSSAAKSHSILQALATDGHRRNYSSLIFRKEQASIKDTVKNELVSAIDNCRMSNAYTAYEFEFRGLKGNKLRLRGLDKEGKVKGLKGYKKLYFDELDHFTFGDWSEAGRRLRGEENQQIIASWNPVSETHWIKTDYIDKIEWIDLPKYIEGNPYSILDENSFVKISEDGRTILIKTTYLDNKWIVGGNVDGNTYGRIDNQVLKEFEEMKSLNASDYNIYGLGNWGVITNDNPFFFAFNRNKHVVNDEYKINPQYYLDLSFDFNFEPCTVVVGQEIPHKGQFNIVASHYASATNYKSSLQILCEDIKRIYFPKINKVRIRITGDAAGKQRGADTAANVTKYTQIMKYLGITNKRAVMVEAANIAHNASKDLCNDVLNEVDINFWSGSQDLINDILSAYVDEKGTLNKAKKELGLHAVDAFRYLIKLWFAHRLNGKKFYRYQDKIKQVKMLNKRNK